MSMLQLFCIPFIRDFSAEGLNFCVVFRGLPLPRFIGIPETDAETFRGRPLPRFFSGCRTEEDMTPLFLAMLK